ncbi:hypothetical protein E2C01_102722 [Portunus trituberculatus]|uniref:Uncharacterized protein n=1 Tax=Portunus trituberculatus TaxID=210409 RepID=A0A5B7KI10_PORTR|nr:hypothetical protein [Portunus trituberculatus]
MRKRGINETRQQRRGWRSADYMVKFRRGRISKGSREVPKGSVGSLGEESRRHVAPSTNLVTGGACRGRGEGEEGTGEGVSKTYAAPRATCHPLPSPL